MRTRTVKKVRIVGPLSQEKEIIRKIHEEGVLHVQKISDDDLKDENLEIRGSQPDVEKISQLLLELSYIKDISSLYSPPEMSSLPSQEECVEKAKIFVKKHKQSIQKIDAALRKIEEQIDVLKNRNKKLLALPQKLQTKTDITLFTAPYKIDEEKLPANGYTHTENEKHYYLITATGEKKKEIISSFTKKIVNKVNLDFIKKTPSQDHKRIIKEIELLQEKKKQKQQDLQAYVKPIKEEFSTIYAQLKNHYDRLTISNKFGKTETLTIIEGYAEPEDALTLAKKLGDCNVYTETVEEAPTKLKNKGFAKTFQPITEMFDTPKYKKYDPTSFVAFFYPLFFGMMLSDIGYGLLLLALLPFVKAYFDQDISDYINILGSSAIATILFGILFGSFFGDLIPLEPLLFEPFADSFTILIAALILGLIHMNLGVGIAFYQHSKANSPAFKIAKDVLPLPLIQIGALILYLQETALGLTLIGAAVALLIAKKGFLGILDVTDYMGTWFSYSRILALALATAGIALAVNLITQQIAGLGIIGTIVAPLILIGGHIFNFTINTLGCAINAARLHYVEFFTFFFKGGGEPFKTFKLTTPQK